MIALYCITLFLSAFFFSVVGTMGAKFVLENMAVYDHPEERSNHAAPVPRGGGIAVTVAALMFLFVAHAPFHLILATLLAAAASLYDDVRTLHPKWRLAAHIAAIALAFSGIKGEVFQGLLPVWLDHLAAGALWLWFINLYNFMDGIDEITAYETFALCAGLAFMTITVDALPNALALDSAAIAGAVAGFWLWNRHPAKIFLGDVGSIPLGFLLGFLLLKLAAAGYWHAALILPAYYISDATFTLATRLLRGEKIWQSHSQHAYQYAVRTGRSHRAVVEHIFALNMALITLAVVSTVHPAAALASLASAYALSLGLMAFFFRLQPVAHPAHAQT